MPAERSAARQRQTKETDVSVRLNLDGGGAIEVSTGVPFLDHLLRALAVHALLDLEVRARGDLEVDAHHTVEDVALLLGESLAEALGDRSGIARFGDAIVPLDESRATVAVDLPLRGVTIGSLPATMVPHFLETFALRGGVTLHVVASGRDDHHLAEATFKALARALRQACAVDPALRGKSASTK